MYNGAFASGVLIRKFRLLFRSLTESPGDVTEDDIANDLESHLKVISATTNCFVHCVSKIQRI